MLDAKGFRPEFHRTIAMIQKPEYLIIIKRRVSEKKRTDATGIRRRNRMVILSEARRRR